MGKKGLIIASILIFLTAIVIAPNVSFAASKFVVKKITRDDGGTSVTTKPTTKGVVTLDLEEQSDGRPVIKLVFSNSFYDYLQQKRGKHELCREPLMFKGPGSKLPRTHLKRRKFLKRMEEFLI